jgi:hypothetical protein
MSPSPGDEPPSQSIGGLAGVFKGLAGGKLAKSPPPIPSPNSQDRADATLHPNIARGLPGDQMEVFQQLKSGGTLAERVAAANSLRYAIADFPFNPVRSVALMDFCCVLTAGLRRYSKYGKRERT